VHWLSFELLHDLSRNVRECSGELWTTSLLLNQSGDDTTGLLREWQQPIAERDAHEGCLAYANDSLKRKRLIRQG